MEISVFECKQKLENNQIKLLDIREEWEHKLCAIPESTHLPLAKLEDVFDKVPQDKPLVVYCHHGYRSRRAMLWMKDHGYENVMNLIGGIDAWSLQIDPTIPRY